MKSGKYEFIKES